ncbi:hypothetical protein BIY24_04645 [Halobacteriovorax marinus]|uniref:VOC family protein n=1 Tax=Halobacteriovorax marinus TaxID=97084 RepID=UPI000BC322CD|nr:VOC family protein [Halobacteriovorax marinus]ATH07247.1 hypothetical protein BIY24_04645 [Halobacteriovorax marinus]
MLDFSKAQSVLSKIEEDLKILGIHLEEYFIDHICYRVSSSIRYEELKSALEKEHTLLHEAMISNRPISTFKLASPLLYKNHKIPLLELPAPKGEVNYEEGFEHIECVIDESFVDFSNRFKNIEFDWKGAQKSHNPELRIKLGGLSIKFHHQSLEEVIKEELKK